MKKLPPLPDWVLIQSIDYWLEGNAFSAKGLHENMRDFYLSLKDYSVKHDPKKLFYRGLSLSDKGLMEFFRNGEVKLKNRGAESWTCDINVAQRFVEFQGSSGIVLAKKIPSMDVIINLEQVQEAYNTYDWENNTTDDEDIQDEWYDTLAQLENLDECELVTETICTKCSVDEIVQIDFLYESDMMEIFMEFLDTLNVAFGMEKFIGKLSSGKSNFSITLIKEKSWIILTK